jgi:nucleoside-diphosphate-sugar epimerase
LVWLEIDRVSARAQVIGIIGGSGFVGVWLARALLAAGHEVRLIDLAPSAAYPERLIRADVRDRDALIAACRGCDVLYNLAAEHRDDVQPVARYYDVNVTGAEHTCEAAERHGIERVVFTSSVAVYGMVEREADETAPLRPFNAYGHTKLAAERVFEAWAERAPARSLTVVRPTVVFGPDNRGNVYTLLAQIARGRRLVLGDGRNRKSMAYVENVADFLAYALRFGPGTHLYNYVDKPDMDMNELVMLAGATLGHGRTRPRHVPYPLALGAGLVLDLAAHATGRRFSISAVRVRKYRATTQFSAARVAASGFVPRHPLRASLIATIRHEFGARPGGAERGELLTPEYDPAD